MAEPARAWAAPSRRGSGAEGSSGVVEGQASRVLPPRSMYMASSPSTRTTIAPALRPGLCPAPLGGSGQGRAAPYALAGSAAARTRACRGVPPASRSAAVAEARRRSTAPSIANWAAPSPSTT